MHDLCLGADILENGALSEPELIDIKVLDKVFEFKEARSPSVISDGGIIRSDLKVLASRYTDGKSPSDEKSPEIDERLVYESVINCSDCMSSGSAI